MEIKTIHSQITFGANFTESSRKIDILLIVFLLLLLGGCASTKVTSYRDPDFLSARYSNILVIIPFSDFESMQTAEEAFADECKAKGIHCEVGGQVLPPTRNYSGDEITTILQTHNVDAVLFVSFTDAWTDQTYVPESSTSTTKGEINSIGNTLYYKGTTNTTNYGGYYISKPRVSFKSQIFDVKTGRVAWIATSITKGNAFAKFGKLMSSLASSTIEKLIEDRVVQRPNQ